tara:strand:+ start:821 stop:1189 length:369 start_codon:yes stop_codon:yes gene_type:complete
MIYFASCEYTEDGSYLKITVSKDREIVKEFEGSDPVIVWYDYYAYLYNDFTGDYLGSSSSMDHWFMDVEGYSEQYFDSETFEFIDWREQGMYNVDEKYPSCIIRDGMSNFRELKDYVIKNKT